VIAQAGEYGCPRARRQAHGAGGRQLDRAGRCAIRAWTGRHHSESVRMVWLRSAPDAKWFDHGRIDEDVARGQVWQQMGSAVAADFSKIPDIAEVTRLTCAC